MSESNPIRVRCPDCGSDLTIDAATGQVLEHRAPAKKAPEKDFDSLLAGLDASKSRADEIFTRELGALEDKDRLLEEKFRRALKRAEEEEDDGKPPARPWDFE